MLAKVGIITVASAGFGVAMGLIMSSFETNAMQVVDNKISVEIALLWLWTLLKKASASLF